MKLIIILLNLFFFTYQFSFAECAKEGESAGGSTLSSLKCCPDLITTNKWTFENSKDNCRIPPPPGSGGSCVKCGDGKCDTKNYENKCNCSKDCN